MEIFFIIQILREINFGEFRSAKIAVFANFGALKKCKNACKSQFRASKCIKIADFAILESPKLISQTYLLGRQTVLRTCW